MGFNLGNISDSLGITQFGLNKAGKKQNSNLAALFQRLQLQQAGSYAQARGQYGKALGAINKGYGNALANTGLGATNAKQGVLDREKQQMGGLSQSLTDRGLYNTTLLDNARRGISSSTNRELSSIDAMLSQIQSQLQIGQAGAQANIYGSLAALFQNQAGAQTQLGLGEGVQRFGGPPVDYNNPFAPGGVDKAAELLAAIFG